MPLDMTSVGCIDGKAGLALETREASTFATVTSPTAHWQGTSNIGRTRQLVRRTAGVFAAAEI